MFKESLKEIFILKEEYLSQLLKAIYEEESLNVHDHTASEFATGEDIFSNTKCWADQLVREKLAVYTDPEHTTIQLINFGKFWVLKGGYDIFLKEGQSTKKPHHKHDDDNNVNLVRKENEELVEARLKLTHYCLVAFWLTIVISSIGFLLSLYNLFRYHGRK